MPIRTPGQSTKPEQSYDKIKCRLCRQMIEDEDEYVITSDFFEPDDPLWPFANTAMHSKCFYLWEKRDQFLSPPNVVRQYQLTKNFIRILRLSRNPTRNP